MCGDLYHHPLPMTTPPPITVPGGGLPGPPCLSPVGIGEELLRHDRGSAALSWLSRPVWAPSRPRGSVLKPPAWTASQGRAPLEEASQQLLWVGF